MKPRKKIPTFNDEDTEREFWATADSTEYIDWSKAQRITLPKFSAHSDEVVSKSGLTPRRRPVG